AGREDFNHGSAKSPSPVNLRGGVSTRENVDIAFYATSDNLLVHNGRHNELCPSGECRLQFFSVAYGSRAYVKLIAMHLHYRGNGTGSPFGIHRDLQGGQAGCCV